MRTLLISPDGTLFAPNPGGQASFLDDYTHRYVGFAAGWGSGKTWAGARKLANLHVLNAFDDDGQPTGVKGLSIAPTYQLAQSINVPALREAFEEMGLSHKFIADPKRHCLVLPDLGSSHRPSEVLIRSAERPEHIAGFEVGHVWGDEVGRWYQNDTNVLADAMLQGEGRLRAPRARFLQANYTFTHEGDCTRVYQRFEQQHTDDPAYALYRADTAQNPLMRDYAEEKRRQLPPELAAQYLDGRAMSLRGGAIYSSFDPLAQLAPSLSLSNALPLHLAIDFNIEPGMHAIVGQYFAQTPLLTAVHEFHAPRMSVRDLMHAFKQWVESTGGWRWPELWVFGDASGSGKWAGSGESCWDIVITLLRAANIPHKLKIPRANPPVADRIAAVNCALHGLDGRVRYKIHPACKRLIADLTHLRWKNGQVDKTDRALGHASDADGYRVHWMLPIRQEIRTAGRGTVGFSAT